MVGKQFYRRNADVLPANHQLDLKLHGKTDLDTTITKAALCLFRTEGSCVDVAVFRQIQMTDNIHIAFCHQGNTTLIQI